ncbi:uncharacterized protein N7459_001514 [Penicillium hispanicum]|uniref:uncharacterized protein n=1 Tax=Penicillium hispanicum TaxID=1080232 RepID=UPI002540801A|nr:uncharacterized protein N7459_001514 [Penicillium hispanicum]KAJ5595306.1 hypothetical protein N7459_001514 [Penicillium hispanicum]
MLLNLGLPADAAAAHAPDPSVQTETPPAPTSPSYSSAFSLPALPFLGALYNRPRQIDAPAPPSVPGVAISTVAAMPSQGESSQAGPPTLARPRVGRSYPNRKSTRSKTSYQLAHPAGHARHKRLKLRPKLLLQLQQVSQTPRPLPILDILPSTLYLPRLARKFPAMFRGRNGLGPNDLIVVMSELYERTVASIPEKQASSEDEDEDQREVVATICQMLQEDARLKGKAEICLNFGPVWEATPLPSGSYEFVAHTEQGVRVMRWALRGGRGRRMSAPPGTQTRDDNKRFTFSAIDPNTRRHPVMASMTRNRLEVFDQYSTVARSSTGPTTPSSGMSVVSDMSDAETPLDTDANVVTLDDGLRTLIIITGIWVAFREGWSHNFSYGDPVSPTSKTIASPTPSKYGSPTAPMMETDGPTNRDHLGSVKEANGGKRCMSTSSIRRSNTTSHSDGNKGFGSLSKRSNSTGAVFMNKVKQRSASGVNNRLHRHSMFTGTGENGRDIVVSRPPSLRQNSLEPDDGSQHPDRFKPKLESQPTAENARSPLKPDRELKLYPDQDNGWHADSTYDAKHLDAANHGAGKGKRKHRLSSLFTIFHRKTGAH